MSVHVARLESAPTNWRDIPLRFLVRISTGATPDRSEAKYWDGDVPWVSPKDMKVDVITDSEEHVTELALQEGRLTLEPEESVLVVVRGMILAHTLPVTLTAVPVTINQDMRALRCGEPIVPRFHTWVLRGAQTSVLAIADESVHGTKRRLIRIDLVNARFGTDFNQADQLFFDQIIESAMADETVRQAAAVNPEERFELVFRNLAEALFVERMDQNEEIFIRFMNDPAFQKAVTGWMAAEAYRRLRAGADPVSSSFER